MNQTNNDCEKAGMKSQKMWIQIAIHKPDYINENPIQIALSRSSTHLLHHSPHWSTCWKSPVILMQKNIIKCWLHESKLQNSANLTKKPCKPCLKLYIPTLRQWTRNANDIFGNNWMINSSLQAFWFIFKLSCSAYLRVLWMLARVFLSSSGLFLETGASGDASLTGESSFIARTRGWRTWSANYPAQNIPITIMCQLSL